jgi:lysophospholipase L1-like esterase
LLDGVNPYRDTIHLNAAGQALLASAIEDLLSEERDAGTSSRLEH